ncbi:hypothetical protein B0H11DRAFT_1908793 [Mycena galericulata]|nr:hypothetical protein B0H11DRAFT_1908793 [Mycena galericulata]
MCEAPSSLTDGRDAKVLEHVEDPGPGAFVLAAGGGPSDVPVGRFGAKAVGEGFEPINTGFGLLVGGVVVGVEADVGAGGVETVTDDENDVLEGLGVGVGDFVDGALQLAERSDGGVGSENAAYDEVIAGGVRARGRVGVVLLDGRLRSPGGAGLERRAFLFGGVGGFFGHYKGGGRGRLRR